MKVSDNASNCRFCVVSPNSTYDFCTSFFRYKRQGASSHIKI
jgi:hypothetical protein